jgi:hypothetical protein
MQLMKLDSETLFTGMFICSIIYDFKPFGNELMNLNCCYLFAFLPVMSMRVMFRIFRLMNFSCILPKGLKLLIEPSKVTFVNLMLCLFFSSYWRVKSNFALQKQPSGCFFNPKRKVILAIFFAEIAESKRKETDAFMKHTFGLPFSLIPEAKMV